VEAKDYTLDDIFRASQLLEIPLYQRRYIWDLESQWKPLWNDIRRIAVRAVANPQEKQKPYFLGSVVIQQRPNEVGAVQRRTVIDGQQRLTTLQLLLDATHAVLMELEVFEEAEQLEAVIRNKVKSSRPKHERFKVWPLNIDQAAFEEVMSAEPPVAHRNLKHSVSRFVRAHEFFTEQVREYLTDEVSESVEARAEALVNALRENLMLVVISLEQSEDPQEIFETLNARGVRLTSADLIKNFIFQRLLLEGEDDSDAYNKYWKLFETPFWEKLISKGRYVEPRLAIFLGQFLVSRVAEEIKVERVFDRFKRYVVEQTEISTLDVLKQIHDLAVEYERIVVAADQPEGALTTVERFVYRTQAMDTETVKPVLLHLIDPALPKLPGHEVEGALRAIESWLVRRAAVRATTKAYNKLFPQLVGDLIKGARIDAARYVETFLREQTADSLYWPDDSTARSALTSLGVYRLLTRSRLRMILEGLEDELRNPATESVATPQQACERGRLQVEHVMPRSWAANWPLREGEDKESRQERINRIGNLTLLTPTKNAAVSNGPWFGDNPKKHKMALLKANTTFLLNSSLVDKSGPDGWTIEDIDARCVSLAELFIRAWPAPQGHIVKPQSDGRIHTDSKASLDKLISSGLLEVGTTLDLRKGKSAGRTAQVLEGGFLQLDDGSVHKSPSGAAVHIRKRAANGWVEWGVSGSDVLLRDLWNDFVERFDGELEDDIDDDADEEDED
jgi:hypothetical protein